MIAFFDTRAQPLQATLITVPPAPQESPEMERLPATMQPFDVPGL